MEPLSVLKCLWQYHRGFLKAAGYKKQSDILQDLGIDINPVACTRVLNGTTPSGEYVKNFSQALAQEHVRSAIEKRLGVRVFCASNDADLARLIANATGVPAPHAGPAVGLVEVPATKTRGPFQLCRFEDSAVSSLRDYLSSRDLPLLIWKAHFSVGASFIVQNLQYDTSTEPVYRKFFFLRTEDHERPFDAELRQIADMWGIESSGPPLVSELFDKAIENSALIVLIGASKLKKNVRRGTVSLAHGIVSAASRKERKWSGPARFLMIGSSDVGYLERDDAKNVTEDIEKLLSVHPGERYLNFKKYFDRYLHYRRSYRPEDGGSRLKRARWHYETTSHQPVLPMNLRMRAYFACNMGNYSYFDPTGGFCQLSGAIGQPLSDIIDQLPGDIKEFYLDLADFLFSIDRRSRLENATRETQLHVLRLVSTAKYWLSDEMMSVLQSGAPTLGLQSIRDEVLQNATDALCHVRVLQYKPHVVDEDSHRSIYTYAMSIGLSSIVQDDWRQKNPLGRAMAHYLVAKKLFKDRHEKDRLSEEFPYEPHYGRSRMFFLAECARHLIRATEAVDLDKLDDGPSDAAGSGLDESGFPLGPSQELKGCDPRVVWRYCYEVLYMREMNGNKGGTHSRSLSKRHGAYQLSIELLQLLSDGRKTGMPHRALPSEYHVDFIRECAYAFLDIGELREALQLFQGIVDERWGQMNDKGRIGALLDLSLAATIGGDIHTATRRIAEAGEILSNWPEADVSDVSRIERRLKIRRANVAYLSSDFDVAIGLYEELERHSTEKDVSGKGPIIVGEAAHCYVAALAAKAITSPCPLEAEKYRTKAFSVCIQNGVRSASTGNQHDAMGFRIAQAHLFRRTLNMVDVGEGLLDAVYDSILKYGCSERTYLAFMLEAGRTVFDQGRWIRAYTSYARPCMRRAEARGFQREALHAGRVALAALEKVEGLHSRLSPDELAKFFKDNVDEEKKHFRRDRPRRIGSFARDPLYAYETADVVDSINELARLAAVRQHIEEVRRLLARLDD